MNKDFEQKLKINSAASASLRLCVRSLSMILFISLKNLYAKPVRTACLVIVVLILAFTVFGGSIIALNLQQGLSVMSKRFGADMMVVPLGASDRAQSLLLGGKADYFYFDAGVLDKVLEVEGVEQATAQFFLSTISFSDCCDLSVQLIAYDPKTDFVVQPWIAEKLSEQIKDGQIVIGNKIMQRENGTVKLYGHEYPVAARLSASASGFDTAIFMTMNTMDQLIETAHSQNINFLADSFGDNVVSAVLVKTDPQKVQSIIAADIRREIDGVEVLISQGIFTKISSAISGLTKYIKIFAVVFWFFAIIILTAVFSGTIHERKREFTVLYVLGMTRTQLVFVILIESVFACILGSIIGITLTSLIVFPFSVSISEWLDLPYLEASFGQISLLVLASLLLSTLTGPFASFYAALKISNKNNLAMHMQE